MIERGINLYRETYYYTDGNIESEWYFLKDEYHRENNPAVIQYYNSGNIRSEYYRKNGVRHREDGPAIIEYYSNGDIKHKQYYINGIEITDEFQIMVIEGNKV